MKLSNRTYDILKAVDEILVLLAAFYVDLADIWNLPYGDQIQRTLLAVATVLLGFLKISSVQYHKEINIMNELEMDDAEVEDHEIEEEVG